MKIYNRISWNIDTGEILEEDSFEYHGPVAWCYTEGGTTKTYSDSIDEEYNARMAAIAEAQQRMAEEYYSYWKEGANGLASFRDVEGAQNEANLELMPYQTALEKDLIYADRSLIGDETEAQRAVAKAEAARSTAIEQMAGSAGALSTKFFTEALKRGSDPTRRMDMAEAEVTQAYDKVGREIQRTSALNNIDPTSGRAASMRRDLLLGKAKDTAGARTTAYDANYKDLQSAANSALSALN